MHNFSVCCTLRKILLDDGTFSHYITFKLMASFPVGPRHVAILKSGSQSVGHRCQGKWLEAMCRQQKPIEPPLVLPMVSQWGKESRIRKDHGQFWVGVSQERVGQGSQWQ